jgi:hypothetical protein
MTAFVNPLRRGGSGYAEALTRIRAWTRAALPDGDPVISVTELACAEPGCPPRETVVLVMWSAAPAQKIRIHKAMVDVMEADVIAAIAMAETIDPRRSKL